MGCCVVQNFACGVSAITVSQTSPIPRLSLGLETDCGGSDSPPQLAVRRYPSRGAIVIFRRLHNAEDPAEANAGHLHASQSGHVGMNHCAGLPGPIKEPFLSVGSVDAEQVPVLIMVIQHTSIRSRAI
jgi:hypothetical protein